MASSLSLNNNPLTALFKVITPPPPFTGYEYDGLEYRWRMFVFRPSLFKTESFLLAGILFYVLIFFVGKSKNVKRASTWLNAHMALYESQFSKPTTSGLINDGFADFFNYSTGRRNVLSLHTVFALVPRQDLVTSLYRFFYGQYDFLYKNEDSVELDFTLASNPNSQHFVWGIVAKEYLSKVKENRWDLTFTRTTESPLIGDGYCVMSEFADVSENLLKAEGPFNLSKTLNNPEYKQYIKSLTITDQPREAPTMPIPSEKRERHLILSLRLPPGSNAAATVPLVKAIFTLVDTLDAKLNLRPETKSKLRKAREELDEKMRKELEAEKKEEIESDKLAAKRKAEEERISKLSAAEQRKALDRDKKRAMRKSQNKVTKKA
ncbi:DUF1682-domain-containing protein [Schizopora paradoxa]|uniref:DUF1682-domain-containing protein n=1 Tax=Schizopora paradoxa TaxID=27342 RepID=A0A0H2R549_9AGAM|nr:DUF1682-domain-containing protein [Schizopora paradoxa]